MAYPELSILLLYSTGVLVDLLAEPAAEPARRRPGGDQPPAETGALQPVVEPDTGELEDHRHAEQRDREHEERQPGGPVVEPGVLAHGSDDADHHAEQQRDDLSGDDEAEGHPEGAADLGPDVHDPVAGRHRGLPVAVHDAARPVQVPAHGGLVVADPRGLGGDLLLGTGSLGLPLTQRVAHRRGQREGQHRRRDQQRHRDQQAPDDETEHGRSTQLARVQANAFHSAPPPTPT